MTDGKSIAEVAESLPKPRYAYTKVMTTRSKLRVAMASFVSPLVGDVFQQFVAEVLKALPSSVPLSAVAGSLTSYVGSTLTADAREMIAKRLAGNLEQLKAGNSVLSWFAPKHPEWVLAEIADIRVVKSRGSFRNRLTFDVITGSCAGYEAQAFWSFKKLGFLAVATQETDRHGFGLVSPRVTQMGDLRSKYSYKDYRQLIGLHCYLLLDPNRSRETPEFHTVGHAAGTAAHNRQLLKDRTRDLSPCLLDATISYDCYLCVAGRDKCPRAIRSLTFKRRKCGSCEQVSLVDPNDVEHPGVCISCTHKIRSG
jgi:hypothetical protein